MADKANVTNTTDAYRNINNPAAGEGKQDSLTSAQKGDGAQANEDPTAVIGGGLVVGEIAQPLRGQAGWQGLGKGPTWDASQVSYNGENTPSEGAGPVPSTGAWPQ